MMIKKTIEYIHRYERLGSDDMVPKWDAQRKIELSFENEFQND